MQLWYKTGDVTALRELPRNEVVCLDVETTGLDPVTDEILQVAVIRGDGETLTSCYVRPARHANWPAAQRVHGVTPSMVSGCLPLRVVAEELEGHFGNAELIVGYNVAFDLAFLRAAGISCGAAPIFDVMREFAPVAGRWDATRQRYAWVPLARCAQYYGFRFHAHDALADARATLQCFWSMLGRGGGSPPSALAESYLNVVARHARMKGKGNE